MHNNLRGARLVAILVGTFMVVEGGWGLFSPQVFGVLTINHTRAVIHLVLGLGALWASRRCPVGYLLFLGWIVSAVALLWTLPATREFIFRLLAVNRAGAILDGIVGPLCLLTAWFSPRNAPPPAGLGHPSGAPMR